MSPLMLQTFNYYLGIHVNANEANRLVRALMVLPIPERLPLDDWRAHVPMHLLENWMTLHDDERMAIYIMAQSATHAYDTPMCCNEPSLN